MTDLAAVVRFVHLTAAILLAGSFSFVLLIARPALLTGRDFAKTNYQTFVRLQLTIARCCLLVIFLSALLGLWIQTVNVSEDSTGTAFNFAAIFSLTTETQYGRVWLARMAIALLLGLLLIAQSRRQDAPVSAAALFGGALLSVSLLVALAFAGHASAADGSAFVLQVSSDALHLLAAGFWLGGLLPLALLLRRSQQTIAVDSYASARIATRRFSALAIASVTLLIASGGYNAWNLVGGFAPLFGTVYGHLLLLKLALLLPLLAVGAMNLLRLKPRILKDIVEPTGRNCGAFKIALAQCDHRNRVRHRDLARRRLPGRHAAGAPRSARLAVFFPLGLERSRQGAESARRIRSALIWAAIGVVALGAALARRRRRIVATVIAVGALGYAIHTADTIVSIDAYPATYKRPAITYQSISVANGIALYQDSGCIACHGPSGYGDGPSAQDFNPKPVDLTAAHANAHTAGDLFGG